MQSHKYTKKKSKTGYVFFMIKNKIQKAKKS